MSDEFLTLLIVMLSGFAAVIVAIHVSFNEILRRLK